MKKYISTLQIIIFGAILAMSFQYVFAARPSSPPNDNGIELVHEDTATTPTNEYKAGGLKVGDGSTTAPIITSGYKMDIRGTMYSTGVSLIKSGGVGGNLSVTGTITADTLSSSGTSSVCADTTGTLAIC